ncbi:MAG: hypothetical protein KBC84_10865 [Proteobacteria bacterium]|nr:hypothetical protein [Pseudomonadota bacterium]
MTKQKTDLQLREFGEVMTLACLIFTLIGFYKIRTFSMVSLSLLLIGLVFLSLAFFAPRILAPAERVWMKFAEKLGAVMTFLILILSYFLVFTPIALLLKIMGKDLLQRKLDSSAKSYWSDIDNSDQLRRFFLPY